MFFTYFSPIEFNEVISFSLKHFERLLYISIFTIKWISKFLRFFWLLCSALQWVNPIISLRARVSLKFYRHILNSPLIFKLNLTVSGARYCSPETYRHGSDFFLEENQKCNDYCQEHHKSPGHCAVVPIGVICLCE